jgi:hypothetical protein
MSDQISPTPSTSTSNSSNLFEAATRLKLRFESSRGVLSTEDLWDLPLTSQRAGLSSLDAIAVHLHRQVQSSTTDPVSFVNPAATTKESSELALKLEIVKHILTIRLSERERAREAAERVEKKQRILEIIARKEDHQLEEMPVDELRALAESL